MTRVRLSLCVLLVAIPLMTAGKSATNSVLLVVTRNCDASAPGDAFRSSFQVDLDGLSGATSVTVTMGGGLVMGMKTDSRSNTLWESDLEYGSLEAAKEALHGSWLIQVNGAPSSSSTFTLDANALVDDSFFDCPSGVSPPHGATGVPESTVLSWQAPANGPYPTYVLNVFLDQNSGGGPSEFLDTRATSWDPRDSDLPPGETEFGVGYYVAASAALVSPLTVTAGSIEWGTSPFAPRGYPDATPLVALGGERKVVFTVIGCASPADLDCDGQVAGGDLGLLLGNWGSSGLGDLNDDGIVDGADFGLLIAAWSA